MQKISVLCLHVSPLEQPGRGDGGGMSVYVRELSAALAGDGVECDVFTRAAAPGGAGRVELAPGVNLHQLEVGPRRPLGRSELDGLAGAFAIAVERQMAALEAGGGAPSEVLHANYWLSGVAGRELKRRLSLPLVSTFHTLEKVKARAGHGEADPALAARRRRAEHEVLDCSDAVLASCASEVDELVELYGADPERVFVVPPGVDRAVFSPGDKVAARHLLGLHETAPTVVFVGRLQPLKGAGIAVASLAEVERLGVAGAQLLLVGGPSGPAGPSELAALRAEVARLGLSAQVRFEPPQPHERLARYYAAADCCIVPSSSESFGLVALEAASCGLPCVASAVGGLRGLVEHGRTGFLAPAGSARSFALELAKILSGRADTASMSARAQELATRYSWSAAARRLRSICDQLRAADLSACC